MLCYFFVNGRESRLVKRVSMLTHIGLKKSCLDSAKKWNQEKRLFSLFPQWRTVTRRSEHQPPTFQVTICWWNFSFLDCIMKPSKLGGFVLIDAEGKSEKGITGTGN